MLLLPASQASVLMPEAAAGVPSMPYLLLLRVTVEAAVPICWDSAAARSCEALGTLARGLKLLRL